MKLTKENIKKILFISACVIAMLTLALNIGLVIKQVSGFFVVLTPIIGGFCTAFIMNIVMNLFEKKVFAFLGRRRKHDKLIRTLSVVCTLLVFASAVTVILLVVIPRVNQTVQSIIAGFPDFSQRALTFIEDTLERFDLTSEKISEILLDGEQVITKIGEFTKNNINGFLQSTLSFGGSVISVVINIFLGLFISIYVLFEKEMITSQVKRLGHAILSKKAYNRTNQILSLSNRAFFNFISGQFIEAIILGLLCFIGMLIFRFPYAAVVAVLVGVSALIPILGAWLGGGVSFLLILISNPVKALWFILFFVVLQQLENNFIYPRVVGKQVGLPGIWVLLAVIIGNGLIVGVGALIAVPVASIVYTLLSEFTAYRNDMKRKKADDGFMDIT